MKILDAGKSIKESRIISGLSQEQLSNGICSLNSLCKIERGKMGVSPATFKQLMSKAGSPCEAYPIFENRNCFDSYIHLNNIRLYIDNWCLDSAYDELLTVLSLEDNNIHNYQEAVFLYCRIMYLSYTYESKELLDVLRYAFLLVHPGVSFSTLSTCYLSNVDLEILILMANLYINNHDYKTANSIFAELEKYMAQHSLSGNYWSGFLASYYHTYAKYLFIIKDTVCSKKCSDFARYLSVKYFTEPYKLEIYLLNLIINISMGQTSEYKHLLYSLSTASYLECGFIQSLKPLLKDLNVPLKYCDVDLPRLKHYKKISFSKKASDLLSGDFDIYDKGVITIGSAIGLLRKEKRLSLESLAKGLCSVSKLSKIEHRSQEPSVYLTDALFYRLGYSTQYFVMYGNNTETSYSDLKNHIVSSKRVGINSNDLLNNMIGSNIESAEPVTKQLCMLYHNTTDVRSVSQLNGLYEALKITIPDFKEDDVPNYCLSWTEHTILNSIILGHIFTGNLDSAFSLCKKLCSGTDGIFTNPMSTNAPSIATYILYIRCLYRYKEYNDLLFKINHIASVFLKKNLSFAGDLFFYSSQSYGEISDYGNAIRDARISAGFLNLSGYYKRAEYLLSELKKDFSLDV